MVEPPVPKAFLATGEDGLVNEKNVGQEYTLSR